MAGTICGACRHFQPNLYVGSTAAGHCYLNTAEEADTKSVYDLRVEESREGCACWEQAAPTLIIEA
jgi:hypothetical protein